MMNNETPAPSEHLQNAIIVASLAHATASTPKQRRDAWDRLQALLKQRAELPKA